MGMLPNTGTTISMGRTGYALTGNATGTSVSFGVTAAIQLNAQIGRSSTVQTPFSATYGGLTTPYDY